MIVTVDNNLYSHWVRLGVGFDSIPSQSAVMPENLLTCSYPVLSQTPRLFWAIASWLAVHHQLVNGRLLAKELETLNDQESAIAGVLMSVALDMNPTATSLRQATEHCRPISVKRVLFEQFVRVPVLAELAREESMTLFEKWGFWHNQVSDKRDAIRPVAWLIRNCPELRIRSILGASLDAEVMNRVLLQPQTATDLMAVLPYTYASIHEAATRLSDRGLLARRTRGRAVVLFVPQGIGKWLEKIPA